MKERLRVLYAEDNAPDADLTKTHFELNAPDIELEVVDTGRKCLSRLEKVQHDVLLLDYRLPDMDGTDVLKELAAKEDSLPVVMVTSVGDDALVVQVLRLGACDYVPKHGNYLQTLPAVLKNAVTEYRGAKEQGRAAGPRTQRRILYVENNPADIDLTLKHFAEAARHFNLQVLRSSREAFALLQHESFDLALLDLRMPDMNALDLVREAKHSGLSVPFVIITGRGDEEAAIAALKLGAYDYIVKRDNYLTQLPYAIDNAIARSQLAQANRRLQIELIERERAQTENARLLAQVTGQKSRLNEIIATVPGLVWEIMGSPVDAGKRMSFISSQVERMLGYSIDQWLSTPNFWLSIIHPEDRGRAAAEAAEFFASGKGGISQFRWIAKDGSLVWVDARSTVISDNGGNHVGMRGVFTDITAAKEAERTRAELEQQLRQAQRLESIGQLAGGVAHDFNNLLSVIVGYAHLMLDTLSPGDPLTLSILQIIRAADRATDLTRQLLAFSRRQLLQPRVLDLNSLITESAKMLKRVMGEDIELETILDPELGAVKADAGQIDQVLLNLTVNARDAMPQGGKLTVKTTNVTLDEALLERQFSIRPGSYVMLTISDTGFGMDSETMSHVFEPFFTTKEQGRGTGLGLSTVYGIVRQSGGEILVSSEPGRGTTLKIYLPRIHESFVTAVEPRADPQSPRGSETVLVVEDEEMVRKLACQSLRHYGYQVVEAANAGEALLACERHREPISLMVTDVVMPQMSGRELALRLSQLQPEMKVLYISGYTDDKVIRHGLLDSTTFFLGKPFIPSALAQKVRWMLDQ